MAAPVLALDDAHVSRFIDEGFVRIDGAFPRELAEQGRAILWRDIGWDADDPATWPRPVVRLGDYPQPPFRAAANTPVLHAAFDRLVGKGRWVPRPSLGSWVARFPSAEDPGDTGWHIDASFPGPASEPDGYATWRVNVTSAGRALLMLFLFSDVGEDDAPTRIRVGSHLDIPPLLAAAGADGLVMGDLTATGSDRPVALATGPAGTVYLCHPFLVHAGQPHRGRSPRFLAQPPLHPAQPLRLDREDGDYSPVEEAIRRALGPIQSRT
jgi:hypothetical protein